MTTRSVPDKPSPMYALARRFRWNAAPTDSMRYRCWRLTTGGWPWWDWGHRLMVLIGDDFGGNAVEPEMRTLWYRRGPAVRMFRTGYPTHPPRSFIRISDYRTFKAATLGLDPNSDQHYEWRAICTSQDGDLLLGRQYWGGKFHGLDPWETELLRRHLNRDRRRRLWGLRDWLYSQALDAAVAQRKPFSCQQTPPKGTGYSHWHCQLPKRHSGQHRSKAATWEDA